MKRLSFFVGVAVFACMLFLTTPIHVEAKPEIVIEKPLSGTVFEIQSDVTLSGSANPGIDLVINTKDGEYARLKADDKGRWSYTIPTVSEGSQTIEVKATQKINSLSEETSAAYVTYVVSPPAASGVGRLAETGTLAYLLASFGFLIILVVAWLYRDYRKHKKPLQKLDPKVNYSFWHHLHVVSLPLIKYRLSINVDRRLPDRSKNIRRY